MRKLAATLSVSVLLSLICFQNQPAHAGLLRDLRHRISSLWSQRAETRQSARGAWRQAAVVQNRCEAVHDRLERTQQLLAAATAEYQHSWLAMKRTEARLVRTRHEVALATRDYNRHRKLVGQRMVVMHRMGRMGYLPLVLGSRNLSDLTRRTYLFNTLSRADAEMQDQLRRDRERLLVAQNLLMAQWDERNRLQRSVNQERERIYLANLQQASLLRQLNSSRQNLVSYAMAQEQSSEELAGMINQLYARRASIIAAYDAQHPRRSRRSSRNRGFELRPMPVGNLIYRDSMEPEAAGSLQENLHLEGQPSAGLGGDDSWGAPVRGRLSSRYGMRYHPILHRVKLHTGDDLAAAYGTPIRAAHAGRVLWAGWKKAYGNTIIIDTGNGITTLYGHASKLGVRAGQPIARGEYIGNVGSTGWSTGAHLHFEVRKNGRPINPTPYLHR